MNSKKIFVSCFGIAIISFKKINQIILIALILCSSSIGQNKTYYLDVNTGSDDNTGISENSAWKSIEKISSRTFFPGDKILLKAGSVWEGQLLFRGSGDKNNPIVIDKYGDGKKPQINGNGLNSALLLKNQEYIEVNNLCLTNEASEEGLRRGFLFVSENENKVYRHILLNGLEIEKVKGKLGADMVSKATGGIGFEIRGNENLSRFDDLIIENCNIKNVDNVGIYIWSELNLHPRDSKWNELKCTNVVIRNNRLTNIGKNAMIIRISQAPIIEKNIIERAAARFHGNAIVIFGCKDALIQYNEVYGTKYYGLEGAAYDSDYNCEGTVIQYNYSHDNEGGMINFCNNPSSKPPRGYNDGTIVRYNISQNDIYRVFAFDGPVTNTYIYNNTVYVGESLSPKILEFDTFGKAPGYAQKTFFRNNIIYNVGKGYYVYGESKENVFENNCFYGFHSDSEPNDAFKIIRDPLFLEAGKGGNGFKSLIGYQLKENSPCIGKGVKEENHPLLDILGNPISSGADKVNIGAVQFHSN